MLARYVKTFTKEVSMGLNRGKLPTLSFCRGKEPITWQVKTLIALVLFLALTLFGKSGHADLPAPAVMPGFPMVAGKQVMIMWIPVPGAVKYNFYVNGKKVGEAVAPPFQFPTPEKGGTYKIEIAAVDTEGKEGAKGAGKEITIVALTPPKNLIANFIAGSPAIRWDAVEAAAFYNVYRKPEGKGSFKLVGSVQTANFRDSDVESGGNYEYGVTAKDVAGTETDVSKATVIFRWPEAVKAKAEEEVEFLAKRAKLVKIWEYKKVDGPDGQRMFLNPREIVNVGDELFIVDTGRSQILVFDTEGNLKRILGSQGFLKGQFTPKGLYYVGILADGTIAAVDVQKEKVVIFSGDGPFLREFKFKSPKGTDKYAKGSRPGDVAVDSEGKFFVTDPPGNRVVVFDENGEYLKEWGETATPERKGGGYFAAPGSIVVDKKDNVFVLDVLNGRVQKFSNDGEFIFMFGDKAGAGRLLRPSGLYLGEKGFLYVTDMSYNNVNIYDSDTGKYLGTFTDESGKHEGAQAYWPVRMPNSVALVGSRMFVVQQVDASVAVLEILD